ncbi:hypothetical protein H4582DRAFT_2218058 [Lactarius indigo]|nr:hypothetical protein H4582DRAFT_2218058 [Lactarius indigo]
MPTPPEAPAASQSRPRVRKVTLRLSQPSAPDTPAAMPGLLPLPPPPPEGHVPPQTPALPPLPPQHLPPVAGPVFGGQHSSAGLAMNVPPTYAHPYGAIPYPPPYPPFQPWGYAQYPMAPPLGFAPGPFPENPLATQRATTGDEDPPAHRERGRVADGPTDQDVPTRGHPGGTGRDGGAGVNSAAPSSTMSARPGKTYPNKEVSYGVWRFQTEVLDDHIKHTFTTQTDTKWPDFREEVLYRLERHRSTVRIVFRIVGEGGGWSDLASEYDWADAISRLTGKIRSARTRAVSLEIKNMQDLPHTKARRSKGKGREKRCRDDDIPPAPSPDAARQLDCLIKLQQHLSCNKHSGPGKKTYCLLKKSGENTEGGHEELTHEEMTLWAKHISLGKATIHTPPNVNRYDYPSTKKARTVRPTPEVHVSVNITPTSEAGNSTTHLVSAASTSTPGPSRLAGVDGNPPCDTPSGVAGPSTLRPTSGPRPSRILVLLDCLVELRVPTMMELLLLMDEYEPAIGLSYVSIHEEFVDLGIMDSVDLYSLPVELLATFGGLGHDLAHRLNRFCENLFIPLGLVETRSNDSPTNDSLSQQEVALQDLEERAPRSLEDVHTDEVVEISDEETLVDGASSDDDPLDGDRETSYRATSYEV